MKNLILSIFIVIVNLGLTQSSYKLLDDCYFSVMIPTSLEVKFVDSSPEFCDYELIREKITIQIKSLNISHFDPDEAQSLYQEPKENSDILISAPSLYQEAQKNSGIKISYKIQKYNWFIISGTDNNGNIVYWKRVVGDNFISDLYIEYDVSKKDIIEPHISKMSSSFKSL